MIDRSPPIATFWASTPASGGARPFPADGCRPASPSNRDVHTRDPQCRFTSKPDKFVGSRPRAVDVSKSDNENADNWVALNKKSGRAQRSKAERDRQWATRTWSTRSTFVRWKADARRSWRPPRPVSEHQGAAGSGRIITTAGTDDHPDYFAAEHQQRLPVQNLRRGYRDAWRGLLLRLMMSRTTRTASSSMRSHRSLQGRR